MFHGERVDFWIDLISYIALILGCFGLSFGWAYLVFLE
jgi:hypothetical protein